MIGPVNTFRLEITKDDTSAKLLIQESHILNDTQYFSRFGTPKYTHYTKPTDRTSWVRVKSAEELERENVYRGRFYGSLTGNLDIGLGDPFVVTPTWTVRDVDISARSVTIDIESTHRGLVGGGGDTGRRVTASTSGRVQQLSRSDLESLYPTRQQQHEETYQAALEEARERANRSEMQRRAAQAAADEARREEERTRQRRPWDRARAFFGRD